MHDPDEPIILHRADIINRKGPFRALKDEKTRNDFDGHLVRLFTNLNFKILMVVIDKESYPARHSVQAWNPYHYCLKLLLERFCGFLNFRNATGDVMAESRGGKEDSQIKKEFRDFFENGTYYMAPEIIQNVLTSKEIKLKKKNANIAGLQIADLPAHPSKQDVLLDNGIITDGEIGDFCRRLLPVLRAKYNRNYKNNRIEPVFPIYTFR